MSKLKLIITEEAFSDIDSISDYIAKDNVLAAKKFIKDLFVSLTSLTKFPNMGASKDVIRNKNIKIYIYKKQYIIAYKIDNDRVVIFKVTSRYQDIYRLL